MITRTPAQIALEREKIAELLPQVPRYNSNGDDVGLALEFVLELLRDPYLGEPKQALSPFTKRIVTSAMRWLEGDDREQISRVLWLMAPAPAIEQERAGHEIAAEEFIGLRREASLKKFGEQNHPDGTAASELHLLERENYTKITDLATACGSLTWFDILREEFHEAACEVDEEKLIGELADVANVAILWIEAIQRRRAARAGEALEAAAKVPVSPEAEVYDVGAL